MRFFVTGGAGFLGSNLVDTILQRHLGSVTIFDNFLTGKRDYLRRWLDSPELAIIAGDVGDFGALVDAIRNHDVVCHLAGNSDIARAAADPLVDFDNGTKLTQTLLEAMRTTNVKRVMFSSGSGVYGDVSPKPIPEDYTPMIPISTYGASKLASEALISAYCHMFDLSGTVFRFANVVGPHMTHGVTHDFMRRLHKDNSRLQILGDGNQSKPYIHVDDVAAAMLLILSRQTSGYQYYNVGSEDHLLVREIADIVVAEMGLKNVKYEYTGGARGWRADVPIYRLDTTKIRGLGWKNEKSSREAVTESARSLLAEIATGL
jgi:UDP-glucose 4-epimerase